LDPGCWMCSSHMGLTLGGTNCKNIYRICHCLIEFFMCSSLHFHSLLPTLLWRWSFSLPNEYLVCRTVHSHRYETESMQHTVAWVMYQLWTTMKAERIEPSDVAWRWTGIGERQLGLTSKEARWLEIVTYDIIASAGVGQKETSGNEKLPIKLSSRPTRKVYWSRLCFRPAAARLNTAKPYTLAQKELVCLYPPWVTTRLSFPIFVPMT
jgi:hypothetical protein